MADEDLPIAAAPIVAGAYPPVSEADRRLQCLFLGARIRREAQSIHEATARLAGQGASSSRMPDGRPITALEVEVLQSRLNTAMRATRKACDWDDSSDIGEDIRVLEAVRPPEDNLTTVLETSERLLRELNDTEDRAIAADPPLLRNLRRINAARPHEARK